MTWRKMFSLWVLAGLLTGLFFQNTQASGLPQTDPVNALLAEMTPAEKVGQLFLVTFDGTNTSDTSPVYDLITNWHVGGFVLRADNNNFTEFETVQSAYSMVASLQTAAWQKTQPLPEVTITQKLPNYIPLYIGIEQAGGGGSSDQILNGLTSLPNQMALGAAWSPEMAQDIGAIMGQELSALGFNLFLGPSLNVVDTSSLETAGYSGTQTFGGDPYWVGELGKAYTNGLYSGSEGKISVIARNFPGLGAADRPPTEEIATVMKSLEQLKQVELAPFLSVTGSAEPTSQVDGVMVSHIRFQGFQGNIRATTRPISLDATAMEQLMAVEPLQSWRAEGGLTVSDSLGSKAVRLFFDSSGQSFDANNVARIAFLAGNDLLYLENFIAPGDESAYDTIKNTLRFFTQKYQEDAVFAQRVDAALARILAAKLKLYGDFTIEGVIPPIEQLENVGKSAEANFNVAREAVTLIAPEPDFLKTLLPNPPGMYEYMVIFTDQQPIAQCSTCLSTYGMTFRDFQNALLELYGPSSGNQILSNRLNSYSFSQLTELLDKVTEPSDPYLADNLSRASWVIFNIQKPDPSLPESYALRRLLAERLDLIRDKKVVVFAYDAPYYLDTTEISKLTAYYGLFNANKGFVDVAARVLMQESPANGSLPVSLAAVGYDLIKETSPDPNQVIPIALVSPALESPVQPEQTATATAQEATPMPLFRLGETVRIQAGIIRDHNQHLVPDGTVVQFTVRLAGDEFIIAQPETTTVDGMATIEYKIDREGIFEVTCISEPARISGKLVLNTQGGLAELIMPTPTATITPTLTPTPTVVFTPTVTPTPTPLPEIKSGYPGMQDWLLMVMVLTLGFGAFFIIGRYWWGSQVWGLRSALCSLIGGLAAYLLLTLGFERLQDLVAEGGTWFIVQISIAGMFIGWAAALIWWMIRNLNQNH